MTKLNNFKLFSHQDGMALVVCLVFLLILTILGVNSMTTSSQEERMATNTQSQMGTFQSAESAIAETMTNVGVFIEASVTPLGVTNNYTLGGHSASTLTTSDGAIQIMTDNSIGVIGGVPFAIEATATNAGTGARTRSTQGVNVQGPDV